MNTGLTRFYTPRFANRKLLLRFQFHVEIVITHSRKFKFYPIYKPLKFICRFRINGRGGGGNTKESIIFDEELQNIFERLEEGKVIRSLNFSTFFHVKLSDFLSSLPPSIPFYFRPEYIFIAASSTRRHGVKTSIKTVMRKKPAGFSLENFFPENSSWIYGACQLIRQYFLPDPRAKRIPRYPPLSTRKLPAAPFLRLSTRLLSSFSFAHRPARSRLLPLAALESLARSRVSRSSRPHERMIASLIGGLATRKRYGNTISTGERSALINTLRVLRSRQVARSLP